LAKKGWENIRNFIAKDLRGGHYASSEFPNPIMLPYFLEQIVKVSSMDASRNLDK
jgi:hypothetical protein